MACMISMKYSVYMEAADMCRLDFEDDQRLVPLRAYFCPLAPYSLAPSSAKHTSSAI
jgi:hypothetical protein